MTSLLAIFDHCNIISDLSYPTYLPPFRQAWIDGESPFVSDITCSGHGHCYDAFITRCAGKYLFLLLLFPRVEWDVSVFLFSYG
jgi:hypothetical protein